MTIKVFAPAKINLALHVTGQRPDGYHVLDSLVVFADVGDELMLSVADQTRLEITGPFAFGLPTGRENLVCRAAELAGADFSIQLKKNLPAQAGIGGGSSDASAVLRAIAAHDPGKTVFADDALALGADVPVCLDARPTRMSGIGDVIEPVEWPDLAAVLINPGTQLSTPDVFRALAHKTNLAMEPLDPSRPLDWLKRQRNDLEAPAIELAPVVKTCLDALWASGAQLARMSGSGATCFGLFETREQADRAAATIADGQPDWWVQSTLLGRPDVRPIIE